MQDPEYELNQLLSRIKNLEDKNERMRNKIEEKKKEIKNFGNPDKSKQILNKNKQKEKKEITLEDDRKAESRFKNELNFLTINSYEIKDNLVSKIIKFKPNEKFGIMYITGDFNGWEPEVMQKDKDVFYYEVVLIKGFKYYYSFMSNEQPLVDFSEKYEENPLNLQVQNYIDLYQNQNEKTNYFDYKTDMNILKAAQRNYTLLKIDDNINDTLFLEKFQRHVIANKPEKTEIEEIPIEYAISLYYDNLMKKINICDEDKLESLKLYLCDRILLQNSPIMENVEYQYKIIDISKEDNSLICLRLYDHNIIKLNSLYYSAIENCWKIPFDEVVLEAKTKKDKLYHLLPESESKEIIEKYEKDTENIITVHFDDLDDLNKGTTSFTRKYGKKNNKDGDLVKPTKIEPDDVEMNDYEYYYSNNKIIKVRNKDDNSCIEYKVVEDKKKRKRVIEKEDKKEDKKEYKKEEKKAIPEHNVKEVVTSKYSKYSNYKKEKEDQKYEKPSEEKSYHKEVHEKKEKKELIKKKEKKPAQFLVYYTFYNNIKPIILHIHILDKSIKYSKIEIKEISDNVDPHILKKDNRYINNNSLLLISNSIGPIKLYFKGKKIQMEAKLVNQNKLYKLDSANGFESVFHQVIVSTITIKNYKKLNNELMEECKESVCKDKDILNGIDVKIEYNSTFDENTIIAVSPCLLREISPEEEKALKTKTNTQKQVKKSYEMQKFDLIKREMAKYRKYTKEMINKMSISERDNLGLTLDDYKSTMNNVTFYIQDNELWDLVEEVETINNEIENLLKLID